ncbi:hypothetical protein C8R44DRAFT_864590 [Mycena epipterygia]|nr:hypothetical protein C8R44DRAFT_864590 [Mycena epipterygia]
MNSTYNVDACLTWCAGIDGCVFVNLYYEFNNPLLDFVFSEKPNLNAAEKTNFGGQALYPQVGNETVLLSFITQSSGWGLDSLVDPTDPEGYELVFGPTGDANNAPGYMGFALNPNGGCAYFNIWRAVVSGIPTTYTCSMYYLVADESTAVNFGQGDLVGYTVCDFFCFTASYANWIGTSPANGSLDASIFFFAEYAHTGHGVALLGSASGTDSLAGTLTPAAPLKTKAGTGYVIQAFMVSTFSGEAREGPAKVDILWNGVRVGGISGYMPWTLVQVAVTGTGNDTLSFIGGAAPAWTFIDDVYVYEGSVAN